MVILFMTSTWRIYEGDLQSFTDGASRLAFSQGGVKERRHEREPS